MILVSMAGFIIATMHLSQKRHVAYHRDLKDLRSESEKKLIQAEIEMQEQTLQAISRDIHDNIALGLTLSKLHLHTVQDTDTPGMRRKIDASIELIGEAINNLRNISHGMDPAFISDRGLLHALEKEIDTINSTAIVNVRLMVYGVLDSNPESDLMTFRIVQECLNNVIKHANASNAYVVVTTGENEVEVIVRDDGGGFCPSQWMSRRGGGSVGSGIRNIIRRATIIGANCTFTSAPGKGTSVRLYIPSHTKNTKDE